MDLIHPCYSTVFAKQAATFAGRLAVAGTGGNWTFSEAAADVERIAQSLRRLAVGTGPVGVVMDHNSPQIIALLGVMQSGLTAMPLDPYFPKKILATTLQQAGASIVISGQSSEPRLRSLLPSRTAIVTVPQLLDSAEPPDCISSPNDPNASCAMLHTFAADGGLRGVACSHRTLMATDPWGLDDPCSWEPERLCVTSACHHSLGFFTVFRSLLRGESVLPFDVRERGFAELKQWLQTEQITGLQAFSSIFRHLGESLSRDDHFPQMRRVQVGGEPVFNHDLKLFRRHFPKGCLLVNTFSVTEANGPLCDFTFDDTGDSKFAEIPVGHPRPGCELILVNEKNQPVRDGEKGQVAFRTASQVPNHSKDSDSENLLIPSPDGSAIPFLKTGDLGRITSKHGLVLLGRKDRQIKIRGQRIQPDRIEALLRRHPSLRNCHVADWGQGSQQKHLVAWIVPNGASVPSLGELRAFLSEDLPESMLPSTVVALPELPLEADGAVNVGALGDPFSGASRDFHQPANAIELKLLHVFQKILRRREIGMTASFFESGGDSLLAAVLLSRIQESFGLDLPLEELVKSPTIRGLAHTIRETPLDREYAPLLPIKTTGNSAPLFYAPGAGIYAGTNDSLGNHLQNDHPFYSLRYRGIDGVEQPQTSIQEIAAYFVQQIRRVQPDGPYHIGGGSFGGLVAFEAARQLSLAAQEVAVLVIEDTRLEQAMNLRRDLAIGEKLRRKLCQLLPIGQQDRFSWKGLREGIRQLRYRHAVPKKRKLSHAKQVPLPKVYRFHEVLNASLAASKSYVPQAYAGRTIVIRNLDDGSFSDWYEPDPSLGWGKYCSHLEIRELTGKHGERGRNETILREFATLIDSILRPPYEATS